MSRVFYTIDTGVEGVRVATEADEEQIFNLLVLLHKENAFCSMNPVKVVAGIKLATERRGGIIFVIDEGPKIVASLGVMICTDWFSDEEFLSERWLYVHPDHRRSNHARKLLEQAKWTSDWFSNEARKKGRPPVTFRFSVNCFDRTEGKVRLFARHMPCIGAHFVYGNISQQNDKMQREMRRIEEMNVKSHRERSREVVPLVETILRLSQQGTNHV